MPWQKKVRGKLSKKRYGTGTVPYLPDETKSTGYSKNFWSGQAEAYRPKLWRIYITYLLWLYSEKKWLYSELYSEVK